MEGYMDILLMALINIKYLDRSDGFFIVTASNWMSFIMLGLCIGTPILLVIANARNYSNWMEKEF